MNMESFEDIRLEQTGSFWSDLIPEEIQLAWVAKGTKSIRCCCLKNTSFEGN
jgi:hypothetical protein